MAKETKTKPKRVEAKSRPTPSTPLPSTLSRSHPIAQPIGTCANCGVPVSEKDAQKIADGRYIHKGQCPRKE